MNGHQKLSEQKGANKTYVRCFQALRPYLTASLDFKIGIFLRLKRLLVTWIVRHSIPTANNFKVYSYVII